MRAASFATSGAAAEVLTVSAMPDPEPGPHEVRIAVAWSGVNPVDCKTRSRGRGPAQRQIPHHDGAGVVESVGAAVSTELIGQRVWVHGAAYGRPGGTAAELLCVPVTNIASLPDDVPLWAGACLGVPFLTAARCLDLREAPRSALVFGAGAVGSAVLQLAGPDTRVTCVVRTDEQAAHVRALGGEPARLEDDLPARVDLVVDPDPAADLPHYTERIAAGGTIALIGGPGLLEMPVRRLMSLNATVRPILVFTLPREARDRAVARVDALIRSQTPATPPVESFDLDDIVLAHERAEAPGFRKVLVRVAGSSERP